MLRIGKRIQDDLGGTHCGCQMSGYRVDGDHKRAPGQQRREFFHVEQSGQVVCPCGRRQVQTGGTRPVFARSGDQQRHARLAIDRRCNFDPSFVGIFSLGFTDARMQNDPAFVRIDLQLAQSLFQLPPGCNVDIDPKTVVIRIRTDLPYQVQVAFNLVPDERIRLFIGDPGGEEVIRILAAIGQPARNTGLPAKQGRGQRALAVDGKDHGKIDLQ